MHDLDTCTLISISPKNGGYSEDLRPLTILLSPPIEAYQCQVSELSFQCMRFCWSTCENNDGDVSLSHPNISYHAFDSSRNLLCSFIFSYSYLQSHSVNLQYFTTTKDAIMFEIAFIAFFATDLHVLSSLPVELSLGMILFAVNMFARIKVKVAEKKSTYLHVARLQFCLSRLTVRLLTSRLKQ